MTTTNKPTAEQIAAMFGVSAAQVKAQFASNAAQLAASAKRARSTGRKVRGYDAAQLDKMSADMAAKAA